MSLRDQLIRHEGLRLRAYKCTSGKNTIGVGRNLDDKGISPEETEALGITVESCLRDGITKEQAMALLDNDIADCRKEAGKLGWFGCLDPVRQDAALNLIFNMGLPRLLKFRKMVAAVEQMDWDEAKRQLLDSRYARQVGRRAEEVGEQLRTGRQSL